jgi:hypothetical protein
VSRCPVCSDKGPSKPCSLIHTSIHNYFVCITTKCRQQLVRLRSDAAQSGRQNCGIQARPQRQEYLLTSYIIFLKKTGFPAAKKHVEWAYTKTDCLQASMRLDVLLIVHHGTLMNQHKLDALFLVCLLRVDASTCFGLYLPIFRRLCTVAVWCNCLRRMCSDCVQVVQQWKTVP